ncbi:glycosyltransferase family 4 protein [Candidatus Falkowbacteria bacterium]|nr:glycosyltransferase family 4 protein [Candidatus Falkowbacteria bacterium]
MKIAVMYSHPVESDGLSIQGNLMYRGLKELGVETIACHYNPSFQKQWVYDAFKPDIALGVGCWTYAPNIVFSPINNGVTPVPWFVANGWVANYHKQLSNLPLVFTTSNWVTDTYKRDGVDTKNFETLHIGFDPKEIFPTKHSDPKIQTLRKMLGIRPDEKMILTIGGDATSKGAQEMLKALKLVDEEFSNWRYVIKTWESESAEIHRREEDELIEELGLNRDKISYLSGAFSHDFMPYLIGAADIYAAPSRLEGFGMIQVEAEACGRPVISINVGGPADTIVHGKTGFLAEVGETVKLESEWAWEHMGFDADHRIHFEEPKVFAYRASVPDLAKYTYELLTNDKLRLEMGDNAAQHAMDNFHYVKIAEKAYNLIQNKIKIG